MFSVTLVGSQSGMHSFLSDLTEKINIVYNGTACMTPQIEQHGVAPETFEQDCPGHKSYLSSTNSILTL